MTKISLNIWSRVAIFFVLLYELLLVAHFIIVGLMTLMFLLLTPTDGDITSILIKLLFVWLVIDFLVVAPFTIYSNWVLVFRKRPHPIWYLWIMPLPIIGLVAISLLYGESMFLIPFSLIGQ